MALPRRRSPSAAHVSHRPDDKSSRASPLAQSAKKAHIIPLGMVLTVLLVNFILTSHIIHITSSRQAAVEVSTTALGDTSLDTFRHCTSPEHSVPWPLNGAVKSRTSRLTCGLSKEGDEKDSRLSRFLREQTLPQLLQYQSECQRLVVYGVAFGAEYVQSLSTIHTKRHLDSKALLNRHGHCFFMFCLEEDLPNTHSNDTTTLVGHTWLIPIPRDALPYASSRRNVKLLKYHGHFLFPYAQRIVWQDAKFFQRVNIRKQPFDYFAANHNEQACVTTMSLPVHPNTFGLNYTQQLQPPQLLVETKRDDAPEFYRPQYLHHCQTIVEALQKRPDVTDSAHSLMQQCSSYMLYMQQQQQQQKEDAVSLSSSTASLSLDDGLLDSGFLVWNYSTEKCRKFNAELQCTLSDQLQCHSDRDQVSFPFVLAQMGLRAEKRREEEAVFDQRRHNLQLVVDNDGIKDPRRTESSSVMVHMTKSACHWYYRALDDCKSMERPSVAILVAGTTKRFLLDSTARHVLQPLVQAQNFTVDYYATLTEEQGPAYRQDAEYMKHIIEDPIFRPKNNKKLPNAASIQAIMREVIENTGASLRGREIRNRALALNAPELEAKRQAARKRYRKQDPDLRFPMLDLRPKKRQRTINGNRNMLNLFRGLQDLWDTKLIPFENSVGKQYDFIMIFRDDTLWLQDFDMAKLLATNPSADAYVLSCDARDPPMLPQEINDYGIVIKREKAVVVGRYFSTLLASDLDACHMWVRNSTGVQRGCNSEMILNWILQQNNITVQVVPQSLLPFERSVVVRQQDGGVQHCFHKFCQSKDAPLTIPENISKCRNIVFS